MAGKSEVVAIGFVLVATCTSCEQKGISKPPDNRELLLRKIDKLECELNGYITMEIIRTGQLYRQDKSELSLRSVLTPLHRIRELRRGFGPLTAVKALGSPDRFVYASGYAKATKTFLGRGGGYLQLVFRNKRAPSKNPGDGDWVLEDFSCVEPQDAGPIAIR